MATKFYSKDEVVDMLKKAQGVRTMSEYAVELDVSISMLSLIYSGQRAPNIKCLDYIGLEVAETEYQLKKAGK